MSVTIDPLTTGALTAWLDQVVDLDRRVRGEFGDAYSEEEWGRSEFQWNLPDKWDLSAVALHSGRPVGFWVASRASDLRVHTHRVAVDRPLRETGVGRQLFEFVSARARRNGARLISLAIAADNNGAVRFYEHLGFSRVRGTDIADLLGGGLQVEADYYVSRLGRRNAVFVVSLL